MYSGEELERSYFQYQTETLPHGELVQSFCARKNPIIYSLNGMGRCAVRLWRSALFAKIVELQKKCAESESCVRESRK